MSDILTRQTGQTIAPADLANQSVVSVVESVLQTTLPAAVAISGGQPIVPNANGQWAIALADSQAHINGVHIASRNAAAGEPLTGIKIGVLDGLDLSAMNIGDPIYASNTGTPNTAAGTVSVVLGRVVPGYGGVLGATPDKLFGIFCPV